MNNRKTITEITTTRSRTKVIAGVIIGILVATGIGVIIWNLGGGRFNPATIQFAERFDDLNDLEIKNDGRLVEVPDGQNPSGFGEGVLSEESDNPAPTFGALELTSNEDSFKRDLNSATTNYLCPSQLASQINTISISADCNKITCADNSVRSAWLENDPARLSKALKISINGQQINPDNGNFGNNSIGDYFPNYNSITWADILKFSSSKPKVALALANGSIVPIYKGSTEITAGVCGIVSAPISIQVDTDATEAGTIFNNVTNAGLGTDRPFFEGKFNNKLVFSKEISETHNDLEIIGKTVTNVEGRVWFMREAFNWALDYIKNTDLELFFSFDKGNTWVKADLEKDLTYNYIYNYSTVLNHENATGFKWAFGYQYNANSDHLTGVAYNEPLQTAESFTGADTEFKFWSAGSIQNIDLYDKFPVNQYSTKFSSNLLKDESLQIRCQVGNGNIEMCYDQSRFTPINTGLSNLQIILPPNPDAVPSNNSQSFELVTLPPDLYLNQIDFRVTFGEMEDEPLPEPPDGDVDPQALNVSFTGEPVQGLPPMEVKFKSTVTGGKAPYKYDWEFAKFDETDEPIDKYQLLDSDNPSPTFKYEKSGMYSTHLTIRDSEGNIKTVDGPWIYVSGIKINANPSAGAAPLKVAFSFENLYNDVDLTNVTYTWEFGDGATIQNEATPEHIYQNPGEYEVKLIFKHPIANAAPIKIKVMAKNQVFCPSNNADLIKNAKIVYRGADRVIIKWEPGKDEYKDKQFEFKYTTDPVVDNNSKVVGGNLESAKTYYDKQTNTYYTVLENLQGGEFSDNNNNGFVAGQKPYYFQTTYADKCTDVMNFMTLNRFQTILYYYNLVFGDNFQLKNYLQPDNSLRGGGPKFFYKPSNNQQPLSLQGVHFTLLNDRKFKEFDKRLEATMQKYGTKKAIEDLYRRIHDRIYPNDIKKFYDTNGVDYWTKQVERNDNKQIDISGAKFAISVSPEAMGDLSTLSEKDKKKTEADQAYEIVLKRGADQKGLEALEKLADPKEMRQKLAMSKEYDDRLKAIKDRRAQIEELYETLYARAADVAGVDYWDKSGKSIQEIKNEFLNSAEFSQVAQ